MRITFRLIVSLVVAVAGVAALFARMQVIEERSRLESDLDRRALLLSESLQESVDPLLEKGASPSLARLVEKFSNRERLKGDCCLWRGWKHPGRVQSVVLPPQGTASRS